MFSPFASILEMIKNVGCDFSYKNPKASNSSVAPCPPLPAEQTKPVSPERTSGHGSFSPNSHSLAWLQARESRILWEAAGNLNNGLWGNAAICREICTMFESLRCLLLQVSYAHTLDFIDTTASIYLLTGTC